MILILGASGLFGHETTKQLLARGEEVRLLVRDPSKVIDLEQMGATIIQGDLIDPLSLVRACQGADRVFSATHSVLGRGRYKSENVDDIGNRSLIDAAKEANISHFVFTSIRSVAADHPDDFFRTKYKIEEYLKASGLSYTILRPSAFMEMHVHDLNGKAILENGKRRMLNRGTKLRNFMAVRDGAKFAVLALTDPRLKNRTIEIGGPENLTNNQIAALYGKLAGMQPKINHLPPFIPRFMSVLIKPFHPGIARILYRASLPDDAFNEVFDPTNMLQEFPMQLTTVEEFIQERVEEARSNKLLGSK
jgi:uncharacterized protein YbjT (DUF2867 family)